MKLLERVRRAREASLLLATLPTEVKNAALLEAAKALRERREEVLEANRRDVEIAERRRLSKPLLERLKLSEGKLEALSRMVESVAGLEDPVGKTLYACELDEGLELYRVSCPIGVVGAIFEARPDVLPQISSLCLKSGNAVILKGGKEANHSNQTLFRIFKEATEGKGVPEGWIQLVEGREEVRKLLKLEEYVDLLVPRGSKEFIKFIQRHTRIPVLGHAEGVCHVYVDEHADFEKALEICYDAKVQYPAVCNAAEKVLVHAKVAEEFLPRLVEMYSKAGVEVRGCERTRKIVKVKRAREEDWHAEYLDLIITVKVVDSLEEAISHINRYGSKHTDAIVTEDRGAAIRFLEGVDSSSVMWNASTRFSDGYRYGLGAEVGISTGKLHARGPVGLEGLTTYKYYLIGKGHVVAPYLSSPPRPFLHRRLERTWKEVKEGRI
ncbi:MAG: glutamate-5-semialdehyde dehydrogenase [Hadesarchaea archaeon]|nr:MAG: glutamate-5-semialdehyde dehydrogenase [Hadesarchaea archaeon]